MKEVAYNLFLFIEGRTIREVGIVSHRLGGRDEVKLAHLQAAAAADHLKAGRFPVGVNYDAYVAAWQAGTLNPLGIFEAALKSVSARRDPLVCVTPVVDGVLRIDATVPL